MLQAILDFFVALVKAIPILNNWFTKTPTEKIEEDSKKIREEIDNFKDTGRPS